MRTMLAAATAALASSASPRPPAAQDRSSAPPAAHRRRDQPDQGAQLRRRPHPPGHGLRQHLHGHHQGGRRDHRHLARRPTRPVTTPCCARSRHGADQGHHPHPRPRRPHRRRRRLEGARDPRHRAGQLRSSSATTRHGWRASSPPATPPSTTPRRARWRPAARGADANPGELRRPAARRRAVRQGIQVQAGRPDLRLPGHAGRDPGHAQCLDPGAEGALHRRQLLCVVPQHVHAAGHAHRGRR